jgi:hypothetical protein
MPRQPLPLNERATNATASFQLTNSTGDWCPPSPGRLEVARVAAQPEQRADLTIVAKLIPSSAGENGNGLSCGEIGAGLKFVRVKMQASTCSDGFEQDGCVIGMRQNVS